ncbi:MAG TPA: GNAT family N-acetyltransferase [Thermomicrobiales bacterium]|nr:GNAT family N-acetyltransferase [Thermomicrobiales bacterium]
MSNGTKWHIEHRLPTAEEHRRLAESVGWENDFHWPSLPGSLANSLYGVVVVAGEEIVGMGRVIGDGSMYFYIQDVAVSPGFQRLGIGQAIVDALLSYVRERSPAFVGLFATAEARDLYRRNGSTDHYMTGMFRLVIPGHDDKPAESSPDESG